MTTDTKKLYDLCTALFVRLSCEHGLVLESYRITSPYMHGLTGDKHIKMHTVTPD